MRETFKQIRLLYVEDDVDGREHLSSGLRKRFKELEVAVDGLDGFEKFQKFRPDIIITDLKMPGMSGLEMITKIREEDNKIPIIITSAHGEASLLLESIDKYINGYILKPISYKKLFDTIFVSAKSIVLEKQLKETQRQLEVKNKNEALIEMIGNIAHQWRQPLSKISLCAGTIKIKKEMSSLEDKELYELTDNITQTTKQLSTTISKLVKFIDNSIVAKNNFKFCVEIQDCIDFVKGLLEKKNIKLIVNCNEDYSCFGYKELFSKSVLNILYNAIEEFPDKSKDEKYIFINLKRENDEYIILIKDNAGGIDKKIIDKIFEPYFTTKHKSSGKGLGLYNVYNMINTKMQGSVKAYNTVFKYNEKEYKGSEFIIKLGNCDV